MELADWGVVGLGRIGGGLADQAMAKGWKTAGYDPAGVNQDLLDKGFLAAESLADLPRNLKTPRVIFLYVHAGSTVDEVMEGLALHLSPGDILVDGGNSYWGDSLVRHKWCAERGFEFVDLGTSGGVKGALTGACFMAGCSEPVFKLLEPILKDLAVDGGVVHAGGPGSGHFVKLVHNGIEFGMMQAIGEGLALMEASHLKPHIAETLECWRHGSVIRSWLVDLLAESMTDPDAMANTPSWIEDTGEVNWLVQDAVRMEVPTPVITQSVIQLFASRDQSLAWAKAVALMRQGFGGHKLGPIPALAEERLSSRLHGVHEENV